MLLVAARVAGSAPLARSSFNTKHLLKVEEWRCDQRAIRVPSIFADTLATAVGRKEPPELLGVAEPDDASREGFRARSADPGVLV